MSRFWRRHREGSAVKDRLQLILIHDRKDISPEVIGEMRGELIAVIKRYLEIDDAKIELDLDTDGSSAALVANIPVTMMKRRRDAETGPAEAADDA